MRRIAWMSGVTLVWIGWHAVAAAGLATFDDFATPPATTGSTGLFFANGDSSVYQGVIWDSRVTVVGDDYRIDTSTPGPLFGIPHSGDYFITNDSPSNDGILLTTTQILTGAWFGQNAYYGFGPGGADQVTIHALNGATILGSVVFDLPPAVDAGQPGIMGFADTSSFASLVGITGYRIDRRQVGDQTGNWVGDNFQFVDALAVPEPTMLSMAAIGVIAAVGRHLRRRRS